MGIEAMLARYRRDPQEKPSAPGTLAVSGVSVSFGGLTALDQVSLEVPAGRVTGVIGPNGAGKTTLFNAICGFVRADAGTFTWNGRTLSKVRPHDLASLGIARTLQGVGLFTHLTSAENVMIGAHTRNRSRFWSALCGLPGSDRVERELRGIALEALDAVGVSEVADELAANLPYPIQKRVGFARAIVARPQLLLLDEPAGGLGADDVDALASLIRSFGGSLTVMLVEHHMDFVMSVCEQVVVLDSGSIVAQGTPDEVRADAKVLEAYLGSEASQKDAGSSPDRKAGGEIGA
jgi:branched-chain amino acid transport system ATP-binding protein